MDPLEVKELFAPVIKKFVKRKIITRGIHELWSSDLLDLKMFSRQNQGYKYLLVVIDTFSKFLFLEPLKSKSGLETTKGFEKILARSKQKPKLLHTDRGKEYLNTHFKKLMEKFEIQLYHTFSTVKASISERVIRTVNGHLRKHFALTGKYNWVSFLPTLLRTYNEINIHRSIGTQPCRVNSSNENEIRKKLFPPQRILKPTLKVGDSVRIAISNKLFENKYSPRYTKEKFRISEVFYTDPITYTIHDSDLLPISGRFYAQELLKSST